MAVLVLDSEGYGIEIAASLTFTDFDPTDATAALKIIGQAERAMTLVGSLATYVTKEGEFRPGKYVALVAVTKDGVRVPSERFQFLVR
jgi:hypothetical protein